MPSISFLAASIVNRVAGGPFHGSSRKTFSMVSALLSIGGAVTV
jgi:hypothetical protein